MWVGGSAGRGSWRGFRVLGWGTLRRCSGGLVRRAVEATVAMWAAEVTGPPVRRADDLDPLELDLVELDLVELD
eukprot:9046012-Pyramimonas_sp.AAC.1